MCGFIAQLCFNNVKPNSRLVKSMLRLIQHRGPDSSNIITYEWLSFGFNRLSILDLSQLANQPMEDEKGVLAFNGEIYNFKKLKNKLENNGIPFNGLSDTEVLLKTINYFGINEINSCSGMWSFAYFNKISEEIIFCRDRIGEKPFYYFTANDGFYFASEVNTLIKLVITN